MALASETLERREELLQAAAALFSRRGYHGTSMQDLAEELGILRGSLYAHISSKEDLLFDIVDRGADRFVTRMEEVVASTEPPEQKIRNAMASHVETVVEHLDASTVFLNEWRFLSDDRRDLILAKRDLYQELVTEIIEEGVEWGTFAESLDASMAATAFLSVANWLYQWYRPDGDLAAPEIATRLSTVLLDGLKER